jgi:Ser/Thr protein kinase RdoA (MazF antagonist)
LPAALSFRPDQIDAMYAAFERVCARLRLRKTAANPLIALVAIRIVELASTGEFDPDKLTEAVVTESDV